MAELFHFLATHWQKPRYRGAVKEMPHVLGLVSLIQFACKDQIIDVQIATWRWPLNLKQLSSTTFTARRIHLLSHRCERVFREISTVKEKCEKTTHHFLHKLPTNDINVIAQLHSIPELQAVAAAEAAKTKKAIVTWETTKARSEWSGQTAPELKCLHKRLPPIQTFRCFRDLPSVQKTCSKNTASLEQYRGSASNNWKVRLAQMNWTPAGPQSTLQEAGSSRGLANCSQAPKLRKLKQWRVVWWHLIAMKLSPWFLAWLSSLESSLNGSWIKIRIQKLKSSTDTWICTQESGIAWNA